MTAAPSGAGSRRRDRVAATRNRIVDRALELFVAQGFAATTVDQIAADAEVGRRTFFRHFPTKESVLFADLVARQEWALEQLSLRDVDEPVFESIHVVFGMLCDRPLDQRRRKLVRQVISREPDLGTAQRHVQVTDFQERVVAQLLEFRPTPTEELRVLVAMAFTCVESAWRIQMTDGRRSLRGHYDDMMAACAHHWQTLQNPPLRRL